MNNSKKVSFSNLLRRFLTVLAALAMMIQTAAGGVPVAAFAAGNHTVSFIGAGGKTTTAIVSSSWAGSTKGTIDTSGTLVTKGDYQNSTGVQVRMYTDLGTLTAIRFAFGAYTVELSGDELGSSGIHINENGTKTSAKQTGSIVKYALSNGGRFLRFFRITQDITITAVYSDVAETVHGRFIDEKKVSTDFKYDTKTENTVIDGNAFTVPSAELKGDNKNSIRMAIEPAAAMTGLSLHKSDGTEIATFKYGDNASPRFYDGVGKVAMAYSTSDGKYYVRFVHLMTDVYVSPVVDPEAGIYKIVFDPAGGAITGEDTYLLTSAGKLDKLLEVTTPMTSGGIEYNFLGWYNDSNEKVTAQTTFSKDQTLTARWSSQSFTVTFDNGGKAENTTATVPEGQTAAKPADPEALGWVFTGWYKDSALTEVYDFTAPVTSDTTIYAKWEQLSFVSVTGAEGDGESCIAAADEKWSAVDAAKAVGYLASGFKDPEGAKLRINTAFGTVKNVRIAVGDGAALAVAADQLISADQTLTVYVSSAGTLSQTAASGDIMSLSHAPGDKFFTAVFYDVTENIELTFEYADIKVTFMADGENFANMTVPYGGNAERPAADPQKDDMIFEAWCSDEALTEEFSFETALREDITLYAKMRDLIHIDIFYGFGKAHGEDAILSGITALEDNGYELKGTIAEPYLNGPSSTMANRYDHPNQSEISSVDVYYDGASEPSLTIASIVSAKGNQVIKGTVYLGTDGKLNLTGGTKLITFAASKDDPAEPMASRWFNIPASIKLVINYFDNHTVTVDGGEGAAIEPENIPDCYYDFADGKAAVTVSGNYAAQAAKAISLTTTPPEGKEVDTITFKQGTKTAKIAGADIGKTLYLSGSFVFSENAGAKDIAKFENGKLTFTSVLADIAVTYEYTCKITFDPNGGELSGSESVFHTSGGRLQSLPEVVSPRTEGGVTYYFMGWYDAADMNTAKRITTGTVFTESATVYAGWSDQEACRIEINNVFPADGDDTASTSTDALWISFDPENGAGTLVKGFSDASGAMMDANLFYGTVKAVKVDLSGEEAVIQAEDLFSGSTDTTLYISASGAVKTSAETGDIMSLTHSAGSKTVALAFYNVSNNISVSFEYEDVLATFMFDGAVWKEINVPFNTAVGDPGDPGSEKVAFSGWFKADDYSENYDFAGVLREDTAIYGLAEHIYTVSVNGAGSASSTAISSTVWAETTGGTIDTSGILTVKGEFINNAGVPLTVNTSIGTVRSLTVKYENKEVTVDVSQPVTGFLTMDGAFAARESYDSASDVLKLNRSEGSTVLNLRFYRITGDMEITVQYTDVSETVSAVFEDGSGAARSFTIDTFTENTVINGTSFTVPSADLKGDNAHSVRMAIVPDASLMTGLLLSDGTNEYTFVYGNSSEAKFYEGLGKVAMAYSSSDGKYYVRFLNLLTDVTVRPITVEAGKKMTVTLTASKDIPVTSDKANTVDVELSPDLRTLTAAAGVLKSSAASESFRWNLSTTVGSDLEYYKAEVYDKDSAGLITTLGADFASYKSSSSDQTATLNNPSGICIKYNKSHYGEAQLRVWGLTKNIEIKIFYKNYQTGEVVSAQDASFDEKARVSFRASSNDLKAGKYTFDFITAGTKVDGLTATVPVNELISDNTVIGTSGEAKISHILRCRISPLKMYEVESVTVTNGTVSHTFTANESYVGALGNIVFARNGSTVLVRFNKIYSEDELTVSAVYTDNNVDGPYTVKLNADSRVTVTLDATNPRSVSSSNSGRTVSIPEDALTQGVNGKSVRWNFSSLAGMDYEYSKVEIYDADSKQLLGTLGDGFVSYRDSDKDQSKGAELAGIKARYNKSVYGEAQLRIWDVYRNVELKVYYKDYNTDKEYAANDKAMSFKYDGTVTVNAGGAALEAQIDPGAPVTKLDGNRKVRFNAFAEESRSLRWLIKPSVGYKVDSISVTVGGKTVRMGSGVEIYKGSGQVFAGAKVRYAMSSDGYAFVRVWAVTDDVKISVNTSGPYSSTVTLDIGDHGWMRIMDIPASARINPEVNKITVARGTTYSSKAGDKTSIRIDVHTDPGWEIDYIAFTTLGQTYRMDNKTLPTGTSLQTRAPAGCAVRFNTDSNGNSQIRLVHVDADTTLRVFYRTAEYTVTVNNSALATMKAEPYGTSGTSEFTDNFAVVKIRSGNTVARQNGIKYWLDPLNGHAVTGAVLENSRGEYFVMGEGFAPTDYQDYAIKGGVVRYYQGYDGKVEFRIWGVCDDLIITVFYDGEAMAPGKAVPADIATYDVGPYDPTKRVDNMTVKGDPAAAEPVSADPAAPDEPAAEGTDAQEITEDTEKTGTSPLLYIGIGAGALAAAGIAAVVAGAVRKKKK